MSTFSEQLIVRWWILGTRFDSPPVWRAVARSCTTIHRRYPRMGADTLRLVALEHAADASLRSTLKQLEAHSYGA